MYWEVSKMLLKIYTSWYMVSLILYMAIFFLSLFAGAGVQKLPRGCGHVGDWALHDSSDGQGGGGDPFSNLGTWRSSFYVDQTQQPILYPCFCQWYLTCWEYVWLYHRLDPFFTTKFKTIYVVFQVTKDQDQLNIAELSCTLFCVCMKL